MVPSGPMAGDEVTWPAVARIDVTPTSDHTLYAGTSVRHRAAAFHQDGSARPDPSFSWSSSNTSVATIDAYGKVTAHAAGSATISADYDGARGSIDYRVAAFPATSLELQGDMAQARQGASILPSAAYGR